MISLQTAENALKEVYLGVLSNQLNNNVDCVLGKIEHTSNDVWGSKIIVLTTINGKQYQLRSELANIYGKVEIADKAIRGSQNNAGAFVNLLNDEMENLIRETQIHLTNAFYGEDKPYDYMNEQERKSYVPLTLNGLKYLFDDKEPLLYGVNRKEIRPIVKTISKLDEMSIQEIIDEYNDEVDFIICSPNTKRDYIEYLCDKRRNIEFANFNDGSKYVLFNNLIPIKANKNIKDDEIYLISTKDFKLHQLCDWRWIESESGKVLRQIWDEPIYRGTLVKYANYICHQPQKQIKVILGEKLC